MNFRSFVPPVVRLLALAAASLAAFPGSAQAADLTFSQEVGFGNDGVDPDSGTLQTRFTFKVVYTDASNAPPQLVWVCVDVSQPSQPCYPMVPDTGATEQPLRDGLFINGEQYVSTVDGAVLALGLHSYYFQAADGFSRLLRLPASGDLRGPTVDSDPAAEVAVELSGTAITTGGAQAQYGLTLRNLGTSTRTGPFAVALEASPGLQNFVHHLTQSWTCSSGAQAGQFTCTWPGDLPVGGVSDPYALSAEVAPSPPYAAACGTGPSPCVSVQAALVSGPALTVYTGVDGVSGNSIPTANDDEAVVGSNSVTLDVLHNDWDQNGDALAVTQIVTQPAQGSAVIEADLRKITYTPGAGSNGGSDSFRYRVGDSQGASDTALVTINPPVVNLSAYGTTQNDTELDLGPVAVGRLAAGAMNVHGIVGAYYRVVFTPGASLQGTLDSLLQGTPYAAADAVYDPDAFRTYRTYGPLPTPYDAWFQYIPDAMTQVFFRPDPATLGQVSVAEAVVTAYALDDWPGRNPLATVKKVVLARGVALADAPVVAFDDTATTAPGTPVAVPLLANDRPAGADLTEVGSQYNLLESLYEGAPLAFMRGTVTWTSPFVYTPPAGFTGRDSFHYAISADCSGSPCPNAMVYHFGAVTVDVAQPSGQYTDGTQTLTFNTPQGGVGVTFAGGVTAPGYTSVEFAAPPPPLPAGFQANGAFFEITTTALYVPPVTVCFDGVFTTADWILHYENPNWVQLPNRQLLPAGGPPYTTICADTQTLSPFVVATEQGSNRAPAVDAGGPYSVYEGGSVAVTAAGSDLDGDPLAYAWDLDGDGSFETPGQTATFDAAALTAPDVYTLRAQVADPGSLTAEDTATVRVLYNFDGFFPPVDNVPVFNVVKAGQAVPVKFSLGGDHGLLVFAAGSPQSKTVPCDSGSLVSIIDETVSAGNSSLSYDAAADTYTYVWKTSKTWAGTCRELAVPLADGTTQYANFRFK